MTPTFTSTLENDYLSCLGLEPRISGSGGRRLIHQANSPIGNGLVEALKHLILQRCPSNLGGLLAVPIVPHVWGVFVRDNMDNNFGSCPCCGCCPCCPLSLLSLMSG
eukprot:4809582-Amphidinium_carterae.1